MAPKKNNAFYFFMLEFQKNKKKLGVHYKNMAEVAEAAGPHWKDVPEEERTKFVEMAKDSEKTRKDPKNIKTSTGKTLAELQQREIDKELAIKQERRDIDEYVKNMGSGIADAVIYLLDTNFLCICYGTRPPFYTIGESTLLSFSLREGIIDCMHDIIRPHIRLGYHSEARYFCEYLGLEMTWEGPRTNYHRVLDKMTIGARLCRPDGSMHPVFTRQERQTMVRCFLRTCSVHTDTDPSLFRVWSLEYLLFAMMRQLGIGRLITIEYKFDLMLLDVEPSEQTEKDALKELENRAKWYFRKNVFKYCPGMECERHYEVDKATKCTSSRAKSWAYVVMKHCCPPADVRIMPGKQQPAVIV